MRVLWGLVKSEMPIRHECEIWRWRTQVNLDLNLGSGMCLLWASCLTTQPPPPRYLWGLCRGISEVPDSVPGTSRVPNRGYLGAS